MKIGVDIDGVVYNFVADLRDYLVEEHKHQAVTMPEPTRWEMWKDWGFSREAFDRLWEKGIRDGVVFNRGPEYAYSGAVEALTALHEAGHSLHYVTARNPVVLGATQSWLRESGIPVDSLTFSVDKTVVPVDLFIEDNVENAEALKAAGIQVFLMDRPWNQESPLPRIGRWGLVPDLINGLGRLEAEREAAERATDVERDGLRGEALLEAHQLITGDRNNSYGPPHQDFQRTANMLTALMGEKLREGERFQAHEIAEIVILIKLSRLQWTPLKRDSWVDIAGYAGCGYEAAVLTAEEDE